MIENTEVRWAVAQRFEFIEWRVYWLGRVNRADLEDRFGISTQQASSDLNAYQAQAPENIRYDSSEKAYVSAVGFQPKYLRLDADRYLRQLGAILNNAITIKDTWFGSLPPTTVMPTLSRSVDPDILRAILKTIERRHELEVTYMSFTSTRKRIIAPHSIAFDGYRWHARAWCAEHKDFRDFVLSRIESVGKEQESSADPTNDAEWNTTIDVRIAPHPALSEAQRAAIEKDYGMQNGLLAIQLRIALTYYFIKHYNLDYADELEPVRQQIYLANRKEVEDAQEAARVRTKVLVRDKANS